MVFGIFATLAEFERNLVRERTMAGLASARARGRKGDRKFALTKAQVRLAQVAMAQRDTSTPSRNEPSTTHSNSKNQQRSPNSTRHNIRLSWPAPIAE